MKGNVLDMAIGIMIGTAFQNVVKSLVDDIITPPFGLIFDGVDFSNLTIKMNNFVHRDQPPVVIRYGLFIQQIIHLLIIALGLFGIAKLVARLKRVTTQNPQHAAEAGSARPSEAGGHDGPGGAGGSNRPSEPSEEVKVLRDIRDLLAAQNNGSALSSTTSSITQPSSNLITI